MAKVKVNVTTTDGELLDTFWVTDEPFEGMSHDTVHLDNTVCDELESYLKHSLRIVKVRETAKGDDDEGD